jgi:hypothetical protein
MMPSKATWKEQRPGYERGDLCPPATRAQGSAASANDPGYIYRLPVDTYVTFQPGFTPLIIQSLLIGYVGIGPGMFLFSVLSFWIWLMLAVIFIILIFCGRARHAGILLLLLALALAALLIVTGAGGGSGMMAGAMMMAVTNLMSYTSVWLWLIVVALAAAGTPPLDRNELKWLTSGVYHIHLLSWSSASSRQILDWDLKDVPSPGHPPQQLVQC